MTTAAFDPTGFDGVWRMYLPESRVRDPQSGEWVPEELHDQEFEIRHDGDVQNYRMRVDVAEDLTIYMGYTCRFGDDAWVPYSVVKIDGDEDDERLKPNKILKSGTRLGEPIAYVKQVYVDPRTQYRISRNPDGTAQYVMLRRLSEDGQHNVGTVMTPNGVAEISKHFLRQSS